MNDDMKLDKNGLQTEKKDKRDSKKFKSIALAVVVVAIIVAISIFLIRNTSSQTDKVRRMLNASAYDNMENTLSNLENMITSIFEQDQREMETLASGCAEDQDAKAFVQSLKYNSDINGIYYGEKDSQTATGKDGKVLDLSSIDFTEHANGVTRT